MSKPSHTYIVGVGERAGVEVNIPILGFLKYVLMAVSVK